MSIGGFSKKESIDRVPLILSFQCSIHQLHRIILKHCKRIMPTQCFKDILSCFSLHPVRSTDGVLIKNKESILERWAEYLKNLLNMVHTTDPGFLYDLPTLPIIPKLDDPPFFDEVENAILCLKDNKTAGPDNIPAEVIKYGGCALCRRLHNFIHDCWSAICLPQQWRNANIIHIYKQNGDRAECGNSRGISLLFVAGKVLVKIMLTRLLEHVVDLVLPESQCGFQRGRSTIDMIFVPWKL